MTIQMRPFRSVLYIPGSKDRALDKARGLPVDAIIFDLEDAVSPDAKVEARGTLKKGEVATICGSLPSAWHPAWGYHEGQT